MNDLSSGGLEATASKAAVKKAAASKKSAKKTSKKASKKTLKKLKPRLSSTTNSDAVSERAWFEEVRGGLGWLLSVDMNGEYEYSRKQVSSRD